MSDKSKTKLEIWGKAQRESARRRKSDCKKNSGGGNFSRSETM